MRQFERVDTGLLLKFDLGAFPLLQYPIRHLYIKRKRINSKRGPGISYSAPFSETIPRGIPDRLGIGGFNSLLETVKAGSLDDVWELSTRRDIDVHEADGNKMTALCHAAAGGKDDVLKMLINRPGVQPINTQDVDGRTPLLWLPPVITGRSQEC